MSDRPLPQPCSPTDQILVAIHDRLGELIDRLPAPASPEREDGTVELTEPKRPTRAKAQPTAAGSGATREPVGGRGIPRPAPHRKKST